MKSLNNNIEFKGTKDGFIIVANNNSNFEEVKEALIEKINSNLFFFKGSQFCDIYSTNLNEIEKNNLIDFLTEKYSINFVQKIRKSFPKSKEKYVEDVKDNKEKPTRFLRNTIRSGAFIEYDGNIIVLGDVNPGAQLIASGNIIVMGVILVIGLGGSLGLKIAIPITEQVSLAGLSLAALVGVIFNKIVYTVFK